MRCEFYVKQIFRRRDNLLSQGFSNLHTPPAWKANARYISSFFVQDAPPQRPQGQLSRPIGSHPNLGSDPVLNYNIRQSVSSLMETNKNCAEHKGCRSGKYN